MNLVAIKTHRYAGKLRKVGDTYRVNGKSDAKLMTALGWAMREAVETGNKFKDNTPKLEFEVIKNPSELYEVSLVGAELVEPPEIAYETIEIREPTPEESLEELEPEVKPKRAYKRRDMTAEE